jgi:hypothetical protein
MIYAFGFFGFLLGGWIALASIRRLLNLRRPRCQMPDPRVSARHQ